MLSKKKVIKDWMDRVDDEVSNGIRMCYDELESTLKSGKQQTFPSKSDEDFRTEAKIRVFNSMNPMEQFLVRMFKNDMPKRYELNFKIV